MDLIGKVLSNRYEIIEEIGTGGMAFVYKARCRLLNRYVAVKVLKPEYAKDETFVKRFKSEAQSAASLTHPNIVSVYDVGEEDGVNYIVMELLESKTLKDFIEERGALTNEETLKLSMQIASALEAAHKAHIIHRDIKPQNIVLNKGMVAKVTDFGIAKMASSATITNFDTTMGSVHYFSPEHAKGGYTDEKSDIYSLGVVMYEMATGRVPFDSDSSVSVALKHIQESPISPIDVNDKVSPALNDIILKAMAKNSGSRYKTATELIEDIHEAMSHPSKLQRGSNSVEAGRTQVIPIITEEQEMANEISNVVPNLRTRNATRVEPSSRTGSAKEVGTVEDPLISKPQNKQKMSKKKKTIIIVSIIMALIALGIIGFFTVKIIRSVNEQNKPVATYTVPDLYDKNYEEVRKQYAEQGIEIVQDKIDFDATIQGGNISLQSPQKGTVTSDKKIYVTVSKGPKLVVVPDVTTKDVKVAKYELEDSNGFKMEIEEVINDKVLAGIVISQEPVGGIEQPYGTTIKVKVSKGDGKAKILMPSVLGETEEVAKKTLKDLKLEVKVVYGEDKDKDNAKVIAQSYPQNQELKEGDLVEITVNRKVVTKKITLDLQKLRGKNESEAPFTVRVMVSVDGAPENKLVDESFEFDIKTKTFEINGRQTAKYIVYIDDKKVDEQTIDFSK